MIRLSEAYSSEVSAKDGGFIFQAVISHSVKWKIVNGETVIDPKDISCVLHRVDLFPDLKFTEGSATLTYVVLSEVNILKRKFELASESIKKKISPEYEAESSSVQDGTRFNRTDANKKHFANTYFEVVLSTKNLVLREVSTSGLDGGKPTVTLKVSTGMVDTLDGAQVPTWENFSISVDGSKSMKIENSQEEPLSSIYEFDEVENSQDRVFVTVIPTLILEFRGEAVAIDAFSNRSSQLAVGPSTDYTRLFKVDDPTEDEVEKVDSIDK
jgi:hypothetical protein